ncbi:MAG: hypothetical protein JWO25_2554 [Alphaproteobacteria bacterium]|nr:hypothetical protein [Alphaproteobacteria bacterium]
MATRRGFVEAIEIGRAGLASAFLIHEDGTRATYTIDDLDADPERFNERLSKLGLLRDAMDRAEPVEIEFGGDSANDATGGGAGTIDRVRRLTRDALEMPRDTDRATGLVVGLRMEIVNSPDSPAEPSDRGTLALLVDGSVERFVIPMQTPERVTADAMAAMARAAQAGGESLTVEYDTKQRFITSMETGSDNDVGGGGGRGDRFDAFVEAIGHSPLTDMMVVTVTTAPEFSGPGNVVPLEPFDPMLRALLVMRGAPEYALLEAALRDKLKVRVMAAGDSDESGDDRTRPTGGPAAGDKTIDAAGKPDAAPIAAGAESMSGLAQAVPGYTNLGAQTIDRTPRPVLVRGVQLLAPLCSASRPVWLQVDRRGLDIGPDQACADGVPTSDLKPWSLREIDIPYRAEWIGLGCFNHGVYRFEISLSCDFAIFVDGRELCVQKDEQEDEGNIRYVHACLCGDHEVKIILEAWHCRKQFQMDVYRIR